MSHVSFPRFASPSASTIGRGPLGDDQLRRLAPSAFATDKHESRSERYTYIPTSAVIDGLRANGFLPVFAKQGGSRIEGKAAYTKHLIRFRYQGQGPASRRVGETFPEIAVLNSHDGTSAYQIMAGILRWICLRPLGRGPRPGHDQGAPQRRRGGPGDRGFLRRPGGVQAGAGRGGRMGRRHPFPRRADGPGRVRACPALRRGRGRAANHPDPAGTDLTVRRHEDRAVDLWTVTNVLQENAIRGGLTAVGRDAGNRRRRVTTRPVNGIDQDVRLNRALWLLGERMAQLKQAA